jgi:hypothetical protein
MSFIDFLRIPSNLPKLILVLFGLVAIILAEGQYGRRVLSRRSAIWLVVTLFLGLRIGAFVAIYVVGPGAIESSDLVIFYYPQVMKLVSGLVPYLDFESHYGPLFLYEMTLFLPISDSFASLAAALLIFECGVFFCFGLVLRKIDEPKAAVILLYYAVNPSVIYYNTVASYNSGIVACVWVIGILLFCHGRNNLGWVFASLSVFAGKALGVLALPAWLLDKRFRGLDMLRAASVPLLIALVFIALGMDLVAPLRSEAHLSTPDNLWFLASWFIEFNRDGWLWAWGPAVF